MNDARGQVMQCHMAERISNTDHKDFGNALCSTNRLIGSYSISQHCLNQKENTLWRIATWRRIVFMTLIFRANLFIIPHANAEDIYWQTNGYLPATNHYSSYSEACEALRQYEENGIKNICPDCVVTGYLGIRPPPQGSCRGVGASDSLGPIGYGCGWVGAITFYPPTGKYDYANKHNGLAYRFPRYSHNSHYIKWHLP